MFEASREFRVHINTELDNEHPICINGPFMENEARISPDEARSLANRLMLAATAVTALMVGKAPLSEPG